MRQLERPKCYKIDYYKCVNQRKSEYINLIRRIKRPETLLVGEECAGITWGSFNVENFQDVWCFRVALLRMCLFVQRFAMNHCSEIMQIFITQVSIFASFC